MQPSILFIGGTGQISSACLKEAVGLGYHVSALNRGQSTLRPLPDDVESLHADLNDTDSMTAALAGREFDAVADFCSFTPDRLSRNMDLLRDRIGQYIFISSASAYAKPVPSLPIRDSSPLRNPFWQYARDKIACEELLTGAYRNEGFPATIVRPSHTYDQFQVPLEGGWTQIARLRAGKPAIIHGDGTSLWTLTYTTDFAYMFAGLLARPAAVGEAYHITGDEVLTWDAIATELAHAAGVREPALLHVASDTIARAIPEIGPGLLGDKSHSVIFDNTKIRSLRPGFAQKVPFSIGARKVIAAFESHPELQQIDPALDAAFDRLAESITHI